MAASIASANGGPVKMSGSRDGEGNRVFKVTHLVRTDDPNDGPAVVMACPGLPVPGTPWSFGNDSDMWAWCQNDMDVQPYDAKENTRYWTVEQAFSTKNKLKCVDAKIEDPLLEPPKISGGFDKYKEEATHDLYGRRILSSSHEMLRGKENEWDMANGTISIQQNVASFYQAATLPDLFKNCVNALPLWGKAPRTLKLTPGKWEEKYHGQCYRYYSRSLDFEHNPKTWDRVLLDEGNKVLRGRWDGDIWRLTPDANGTLPDRNNPSHFIQFSDKGGAAAHTLLNGYGIPVGAKILATQFGQVIPRFICLDTIPAGGIPTTQRPIQNRFILDLEEEVAGSNLQGLDLFDETYWIRQKGSVTEWEEPRSELTANGTIQDFFGSYIKGNVVTNPNDDNRTFLCLQNNDDLEPYVGAPYVLTTNSPLILANQGRNEYYWVELPSGVVEAGIWSASNEYERGHAVQGSDADVIVTKPGSVFVAKYPGVNFLLLGVPAILG